MEVRILSPARFHIQYLVLSIKHLIKIIFQNKNFIVVDKPAGLAVHSGVGIEEKTLVDFLVEKFPEIKKVGDNPEVRPGIVHRLDKDTSGVMIVARNQKAFEHLKNLFKNREIEKKYLALVHGKIKDKEGKIEGEMGRSKKDFRKQSLVRGKVSVRKERYSLTFYETLRELNGYSLLEVSPKTGRMHQIRVHLHSVGHPIVGDKKYTFKKYKKLKFPRMFLHAINISFQGANGKSYSFSSDTPSVFSDIS
jgi:23S rRNA pseudouridine1911/1915/1917 synthase